jgi:hypothetical protein
MKRQRHWNYLVLFCLLSLGIGCGGNSGSGGGPPQQNPTPQLTGVTPNSATAGAATLTLAASGSGFISSSVLQWNGSGLTTTYVSSTSLTAQLPASDLASAATANITVQNPAPGGGTSGKMVFTINPVSTNLLNILNIEGTDLTWDPSQQKLYVAVPATANSNPGTITVVDPVAGSVTGSQQLNSAPYGLAISDDNQYLYAVISGGSAIQRFSLPAMTPDIEFSLGTDSSTNNPYLAGDIKVQPGAPHTLAVSMGDYGSGSVAVFDDAVERTSVATSAYGPGNSLQWKTDGTVLYAAYTMIDDCPYYTTVSDDALYTMPVTSSGVGTVTTYHSSFRGEGDHLHLDPATNFVYGDWGEVINGTNGIPVGDYPYTRPYVTFFTGPLSVVDPALDRFYTLLEIQESDGTLAFQIQSFDQTQFRLLSTITIPNALGEPVNFVRWGQSGLAFVTNDTSANASGKLYILDGSFVNSSGVQDTAAGTPLNPVPTLTAITPVTAAVGSSGLALTITGRDFVGQTTVYWNGNAIPTTVISSTQLSAQVPASDLSTANLATITASNSGTLLPSSNSMSFAVDDAPASGNQISVFSAGGNDLVWDATAAKIYVSMPGIQGDAGNSIAIVDPASGVTSTTALPGADPDRLSISSNDQYVYVGLDGQNAIDQFTLPNFQQTTVWNLGGAGTFSGPYYALDVQAEPGSAQTAAVSLAQFDVSPSAVAVVIYDAGIPRPNPLQVIQFPYSSLQWANTAPTLYSVDQEEPQDFLVLGVNSSGAVLDQHYNGILNYSIGIHYDAVTGLVYTDGGQVIQPSDGMIAGTYAGSGIAVPDSTLNRVFILGQTATQTGTSNYTVESFDQTGFTPVDSFIVENVVGAPTALIRWGNNGLAFTTRVGLPTTFYGAGPGQLYVISGDFVQASDHTKRPLPSASWSPVRRTWSLESPSTRPRNAPTH